MSKSGLGDQNYVIGYKRETKSVNKFKRGLKSKLETTRGSNLKFCQKKKKAKEIGLRCVMLTPLRMSYVCGTIIIGDW